MPSTCQIHITILDQNDNRPIFTQSTYEAMIAENVALNPPAAILKVSLPNKPLARDYNINALHCNSWNCRWSLSMRTPTCTAASNIGSHQSDRGRNCSGLTPTPAFCIRARACRD